MLEYLFGSFSWTTNPDLQVLTRRLVSVFAVLKCPITISYGGGTVNTTFLCNLDPLREDQKDSAI